MQSKQKERAKSNNGPSCQANPKLIFFCSLLRHSKAQGSFCFPFIWQSLSLPMPCLASASMQQNQSSEMACCYKYHYLFLHSHSLWRKLPLPHNSSTATFSRNLRIPTLFHSSGALQSKVKKLPVFDAALYCAIVAVEISLSLSLTLRFHVRAIAALLQIRQELFLQLRQRWFLTLHLEPVKHCGQVQLPKRNV